MKTVNLVDVLNQNSIVWMGKPGEIKILMHYSTTFSYGDQVERQDTGELGDIMLIDMVSGRVKIGYSDRISWEDVSTFGLEWIKLSTGG